ncbi:hypothetical protein RBSWK_05727 [Rhodopirellula baltica SWK14]|uniref:Uncharacterized protein n=1 Tax=Rhodopirellula baltica SWK14 TaxID=993516 RepID=L7CB51_RHOBT|nr:hypothetical protein RBSWK_05727 [Rhodopirellula baltica SWK14]
MWQDSGERITVGNRKAPIRLGGSQTHGVKRMDNRTLDREICTQRK